MRLRPFGFCACFAQKALFSIVPASPGGSAEAEPTRPKAPGFYRMPLGDFEITALSDGTISLPFDTLLLNLRPGELDELLDRSFEASSSVETSINAFLVNTGKQLILVDTGAGNLFGENGGHLFENLRLAGYDPARIDTVLLTHVHADHSGGLVIDGQRMFPNAAVYANEADPGYWFDAAAEARSPEHQKHAFAQGRASLQPYIDTKQFKPFAGQVEIAPGVRSLPIAGHTPGHTSFEIVSQGQKLLLWGDVAHGSQVQFADPNVAVKFDVDPVAAVAQRENAMADAAASRYWVGGAHISFPGIGHVRREASGFGWVPANYAHQLAGR